MVGVEQIYADDRSRARCHCQRLRHAHAKNFQPDSGINIFELRSIPDSTDLRYIYLV